MDRFQVYDEVEWIEFSDRSFVDGSKERRLTPLCLYLVLSQVSL